MKAVARNARGKLFAQATISVLFCASCQQSPDTGDGGTPVDAAMADGATSDDGGSKDLGPPPVSGVPTAVEQRCTELGGVCKCSEPMDSNDGTFGSMHDFTGSSDATECWGGRAGFQPYGTDGTQSSVAVSWTPGGYAMRQGVNGGFIWLNGEDMVSGPQAFTSADKVQCYRYYHQVDKVFGSSGNGPSCLGYCDPDPQIGCTSRNKIFQMNFQNCVAQVQEAGDGGDCTLDGTHKPFQLTVPTAPNPPASNFDLSSSVEYNPDCDDKPCRFEFCIDSTNLATGENVVLRTRVCSLETGSCLTATTGNLGNCGAPTLADFWGGDLFHNSGVGGSEFGFFMSARWQTDTDQWIGPAYEVEGP